MADEPFREFERKVANHYRQLGYVVAHDQMVANMQMDIVASKRFSGIGEVELVVECKLRRAELR